MKNFAALAVALLASACGDSGSNSDAGTVADEGCLTDGEQIQPPGNDAPALCCRGQDVLQQGGGYYCAPASVHVDAGVDAGPSCSPDYAPHTPGIGLDCCSMSTIQIAPGQYVCGFCTTGGNFPHDNDYHYCCADSVVYPDGTIQCCSHVEPTDAGTYLCVN